MKSGKSYVGNGLSFLSTKTSQRKRNVARSQQTSNDSTRTARTGKSGTTRSTQRMQRGTRGQGRAQWQEQIEKFQKASPEEQSRMIEQFRNRRRGGNGARQRD